MTVLKQKAQMGSTTISSLKWLRSNWSSLVLLLPLFQSHSVCLCLHRQVCHSSLPPLLKMVWHLTYCLTTVYSDGRSHTDPYWQSTPLKTRVAKSPMILFTFYYFKSHSHPPHQYDWSTKVVYSAHQRQKGHNWHINYSPVTLFCHRRAACT